MLKSAMLFAAGARIRVLPRMRRGNSTVFDLASLSRGIDRLQGSEGIKPDSDDTFPTQIAFCTTFYAGLVRPPRSGSGTRGSQTAEARIHGRGDRHSSCSGKRRPIP